MGEVYVEAWGNWTIRVNMFCLGVWTYQASLDKFQIDYPQRPFVNSGTVHAGNRTQAADKVKELLGAKKCMCGEVHS